MIDLRASRVVVVGSLNLDYIASVKKLPVPGETVAASGLIRRFGGKGANQAVAAARQGAKVSLIGCVGDDDDGRAYCKHLIAEGIDVSGIVRTSKALTGTALIAVADNAENVIIVAAGANGEWAAHALSRVRPKIARVQCDGQLQSRSIDSDSRSPTNDLFYGFGFPRGADS